jgi:drug/metabolite transporter (DMT)-like permease
MEGKGWDCVGALAAAMAMMALSGAFIVTPLLLDYPVYAGQALRYGAATLILVGLAQSRGLAGLRVTARELGLLLALAATGLVAFNIALIEGLRTLAPETIGTVVGTSPVVLACVGPLIERRRPSARVTAAALIVVAGSAVVYGAAPGCRRGLSLALIALAGESSFSLLALPLLPRLGPLRVSAYVTGLASIMLSALAVARCPFRPFPVPSAHELAALVYLALVVTALAFLAWYTGVQRLGVARAGLFVALLPVMTVLLSTTVGTGTMTPSKLMGAGLVALGLVLGKG